MIFRRLLWLAALAAALVCWSIPASAQFADQATYAGNGAGTANAQTISLPNATSYSDLVGVIVKYVPGATNTGDATLTVNSFVTSPHFRKPSGAGLVALAGGEIVTGQPVWIMYDGTYFDVLSVVSNSYGASNVSTSAMSFGPPVNLQINASVGSNNLTVAIKGNDGNDPSSSNPVLVAFRDSTIANGGPKIVSLQSALSFTVNSGNTMGCTSGVMCRLWLTLICVSGTECTGSGGGDTLALCAINPRSGSSIGPINEAALQTSASGTNGGSSAQTYYCNVSGVTGRAIRIVGYLDVQEVTAGTWATAPTYVQLFGPGIKKPGEVVQTVYVTTSSTTSVSSATNVATGLAASITPTSAANLIRIRAFGWMASSQTPASANSAYTQLFRNTGTTAIGNSSPLGMGTITSGGMSAGTANFAVDAPNTTSSTQYGLYIAATGSLSSPVTFLGTSMGTLEGNGVMLIDEVMD